jgi:hypothetical protein
MGLFILVLVVVCALMAILGTVLQTGAALGDESLGAEKKSDTGCGCLIACSVLLVAAFLLLMILRS